MNGTAQNTYATTATATRERIRVVLVDDHHLIRSGLRQAFQSAGDFEVVGESAQVGETLQLLQRVRPDVLVTDVELPDGNGLELTAQVRAADDSVGIVVLTMHADDNHLFAALDAGASGFVGKDAPAENVLAATRHAAASPGTFTANDLSGALHRRSNEAAGPSLSAREHEVLDLLVNGLAVAQIGRRLYISPATVKTHVRNIYRKLGAGNRAEVVMAAVRLGLTGH
ncbi:response regulator transcription factor [Kineosporia rhizophila]|uniref:response regulator n=1 Tax=Kineosporia TaxID=49184 RepID=UPI001E55AC07|nr:response regulator transcription factor [Kineosporia sp. NBRC 101677]MCE0535423.1 response regulator transcription factor [Kineosporia rhizophila]GLY16791.1 DNA-binding response regulator [Kineosporia sp. NBRC 101677]